MSVMMAAGRSMRGVPEPPYEQRPEPSRRVVSWQKPWRSNGDNVRLGASGFREGRTGTRGRRGGATSPLNGAFTSLNLLYCCLLPVVASKVSLQTQVFS
ncbi:uncharacterized protein SCHCODRAFT_02135575 [Schizophyllum commune H4-8]|uniref:uncharacterized protein n=1 Tax=Schizophyllum commune (strain H4-8 / FGSC 9210) TaxID=578458 RepID=UPI00215F8803|nr:uncharacterized protein SCHCODRAFT_02135575 [Schizophyllum commune H4-8]KAI5884846.1 hypothetical protein SCHCODRAFT_02135575 [Schizophyllum commune H4-8]